MRSELEDYFKQHTFIQVKRVDEARGEPCSGIHPEAQLREILPDEIVIEFDTDNTNRAKLLTTRTIGRLRYHKYNFTVYDHGGRSPHIHVYAIAGLSEQSSEFRSMYKRLFLEKFAKYRETDFGINTAESHLIALENRPHFKHGNLKKEIMSTEGFKNKMDVELSVNTYNLLAERQRKRREFVDDDYDNSWLIGWSSSERLPWGQWNNVIAKNIAIEIVNKRLNREKVLSKFNLDDRHAIRGWFRWAEAEKRYFGFSEICRFCDTYELDLKGARTKYSNGGTPNGSRRHSKKGAETDEGKVCNNRSAIQRPSKQGISF